MEPFRRLNWNTDTQVWLFRRNSLDSAESFKPNLKTFLPLWFNVNLHNHNEDSITRYLKNGQMWDKPLEAAAEQILTRTLRDMSQLADFKIPRYIGSTLNRNVQLHIFCDASKKATAVSAYLRITDVYGKTRLVFILGKTRVYPIKQQRSPSWNFKLLFMPAVSEKKLNKDLTLQIY